jgi:hypothetical protein
MEVGFFSKKSIMHLFKFVPLGRKVQADGKKKHVRPSDAPTAAE